MSKIDKKVAVILHPNFEEGEGVVTIDVLRRAGITVDIYSLTNQLEVSGSHQIVIKADKPLEALNVQNYDGVMLPGGSGCDDLYAHTPLHNVLQQFNNAHKMVAGVCGAPQVLGAAGVIDNVKIVKHPKSHNFIDPRQVQTTNSFIDHNIVTGVSIGTTIPFALKIVEYLLGHEQAVKIQKQLVIF